MMQHETLRVIDEQSETTAEPAERGGDTIARAQGPPERYEDAGEVDLRDYGPYSFPRFITAVLDELDAPFTAEDARLVDELEASEDVAFGLLLVYPDERLLFVGSDPTAKDAIPWFAFTIDPLEPRPAPDTARDALDMLKPPSVRDIVHEDNFLPRRHGEWWLVRSGLVPGGTVFKPGVASKPYGASPLGNHVPREYAFTVADSTFMERFRDAVESAPESIRTPPEAIEWTWRQINKPAPPDDAPTWADIRAFAGEVIVRGTVRHRDDDHYVENVGEAWHRAMTHDIEVYTGDDMATNVHLDYHGQ